MSPRKKRTTTNVEHPSATTGQQPQQQQQPAEDPIELGRRLAMDARNDARNITRLLAGGTLANVDQQSVAEALAVAILSLNQSSAAALAAIEQLRRIYGGSHIVADTDELLERPRHVARVLSDAGLWGRPVMEDELVKRLGELERRMSRGAVGSTLPGAGAGESVANQTDPQIDHTPDFRSVRWGDELFEFTATQAACVKLLWDFWRRGIPSVSDARILEDVDSSSDRLTFVFRDHPALGKMIVEGETKGTHRIADFFQDSQKQP